MGVGTHLFCVVSFEGPDRYSRMGGLAERAEGLARGLAGHGYETHHYFFGDPRLPGTERLWNGHLTLHRWAQWLSAGCQGGVYEAEEARCRDLATSLPRHLLEEVIRPMVRARFVPVILGMEWQTVGFLTALDRVLQAEGLRRPVVLALELAAPSLGRIGWPELPDRLRLLTRDEEVARAGAAAGSMVAQIGDRPADLITALLGGPTRLPASRTASADLGSAEPAIAEPPRWRRGGRVLHAAPRYRR